MITSVVLARVDHFEDEEVGARSLCVAIGALQAAARELQGLEGRMVAAGIGDSEDSAEWHCPCCFSVMDGPRCSKCRRRRDDFNDLEYFLHEVGGMACGCLTMVQALAPFVPFPSEPIDPPIAAGKDRNPAGLIEAAVYLGIADDNLAEIGDELDVKTGLSDRSAFHRAVTAAWWFARFSKDVLENHRFWSTAEITAMVEDGHPLAVS